MIKKGTRAFAIIIKTNIPPFAAGILRSGNKHVVRKSIPGIFLLLGCILSITVPVQAQTPGETVVRAARQFVASLDNVTRPRACFTFTDAERTNWHFVPMERKGLPLNAMTPRQRDAAFKLLQACMSKQGYKKATDIISLEVVLKALENRGDDDHYRDPEKYTFALFGDPAKDQHWGWRLEGHHISLNFSTADDKLVSGTPAFLGSNPAIVGDGPSKGKEVLKQEAAMGFELLRMMNETQRQKVIISTTAPADIISGNKRKAMLLDPPGLSYHEMTPEQQALMRQLVAVYIDNYTKLMADIMLKEITTAGWDKLHFAWAGATAWGQGHYYRIQGPTVLIEYDNTQNNANHVHTVLRDLKNDFGEDVLQRHYETAHVLHSK